MRMFSPWIFFAIVIGYYFALAIIVNIVINERGEISSLTKDEGKNYIGRRIVEIFTYSSLIFHVFTILYSVGVFIDEFDQPFGIIGSIVPSATVFLIASGIHSEKRTGYFVPTMHPVAQILFLIMSLPGAAIFGYFKYATKTGRTLARASAEVNDDTDEMDKIDDLTEFTAEMTEDSEYVKVYRDGCLEETVHKSKVSGSKIEGAEVEYTIKGWIKK